METTAAGLKEINPLYVLIKAQKGELLDFTLSDMDVKFPQRLVGQAKASLK